MRHLLSMFCGFGQLRDQGLVVPLRGLEGRRPDLKTVSSSSRPVATVPTEQLPSPQKGRAERPRWFLCESLWRFLRRLSPVFSMCVSVGVCVCVCSALRVILVLLS